MCGKANPAGSVTCQFCGARIVPLGSAASKPSNPTPEEDTEGWLRRLRGGTPAQTPPQAPASAPSEQPAEPAPQEEEIPDWLARIRERSRSENDGSDSEQEQSSEPAAGPDWLSSTPGPDEKAATPGDANDDWLTRLRTPDESDQVPPEPATPSPAAPESNWQPFGPEATENSADESSSFSNPDQLRDWLRSLGDDNPPASEPPARQQMEAAPPVSAPAEQTSGTNDVPEWLREFDAETPTAPIDSLSNPEPGEIPGSQPAQPETPLSIPPAGQIPDWLAAFEDPEGSTPAGSTGAQAFSAEETQGDVAGPFVSGQDEWTQPPTEEGPATSNESELPDWLRNVTPTPSTAKPETPTPTETPAWLAVFDPSARQAPVQPEAAGDEASPSGEAISPFSGEDLPQWLSEKPARPEAGPAARSGLGEEGIPRLPEKLSLGEDEMPSLPDWLGEAQAEEAAPAQVSAEGIEPAQLPGWLQAMRPVEAAVSESTTVPEDNQRAERSGPLVGLRGLLTGENLVTQYQKPPALSVKLRMSDKQRINASLLENILAEETQSKPLRKERTRSSQTVVRVLVGLLLIAVLAITLFSGAPAGINTPILYQAETVQFNSLVNGLPDGAPVLLAFDYEASLSGEMGVSAAPIIDHLVAKQARLALISTIPAGPILGQQLIEAAAQKHPGYSLANKTINLGYLPGGATSLQEFALNPQRAAPYALNATEGDVQVAHAWENQALLGVTRLQDFAAIIVITDNSETGRAWVEQVQPTLSVGNTPMLMVVSAQAAPVIQPYFESSQVKGMVAGLAGGMTYEQLRQVPGAAHTYWSAFQAGLLTAMAFIVIGIIFQGVLALFPASKSKREA
jgi:hypothetical protein